MISSDLRNDIVAFGDSILKEGATLEANFPSVDWESCVIAMFDIALSRLDAIRVLIDRDVDSSLVLARSLFELTAITEYVAKCPESRLLTYRKRVDDYRRGKNDNPLKRSLPPLKTICCDVGGWIKSTYEESELYRYTSDATHGGAWTTLRRRGNLRDGTSSDFGAAVLFNSTYCVLTIGSHLANVPRSPLSPEQVDCWIEEADKLGSRLAESIQTAESDSLL